MPLPTFTGSLAADLFTVKYGLICGADPEPWLFTLGTPDRDYRIALPITSEPHEHQRCLTALQAFLVINQVLCIICTRGVDNPLRLLTVGLGPCYRKALWVTINKTHGSLRFRDFGPHCWEDNPEIDNTLLQLFENRTTPVSPSSQTLCDEYFSAGGRYPAECIAVAAEPVNLDFFTKTGGKAGAS